MKRFMLLLLSATLLSGGCASQKQASATHAGHAAYRTALAALESQRFVVNLDEVYTRKGQKLNSHQSYLRMQGAFAEFCFAPDFFTPRNGHIMSRLRMPDEQADFEKIRTKRNGDIQFRIRSRRGWTETDCDCLMTLYHDSDRVYLEFFDYRGRPEGTAKGVVRPLKE